jgi:hypothetical protein
MLKSILKVEGVIRLSKTQQKNVKGGMLNAGNDDSCGINEMCSNETEAIWSGECEAACMTGFCSSGETVYRFCEATGF